MNLPHRSRTAALALLCLAPIPAASAQATYDVYHAGARLLELTLGPDSCSIRRKDVATNRWEPPRQVMDCRFEGDTTLAVSPGIALVITRLPELGAIPWGSLKAVGWPDETTIQVPRGELQASVGGRQVTATRWSARHVSSPVDLVIGPGNAVLAASDLRRDLVLVRRGYEAFTTVGRWQGPGVSQPTHGYRALGTQMVPARDGVGLATLVYLPDGPPRDRYPTILIRTPYGISEVVREFWHYPARGYALVVQAARGTAFWDPANRSEGTWGDWRNEAPDGAATLEWITRQPWSNGDICMQGGSYLGYTQWTATMAGNPALKCVVPEVSMGTVFSDQPYWGGGFVQGTAYYIFWMLNQPTRPGVSWTDIMHHRPLMTLDEFATGKDIPQWNVMLQHWRNDAYWRPQDWYNVNVPRGFASFHISGWFDDDLPGTRSNWELMRRTGTAPRRLILGPWKHGYNADRALNDIRFGEDAVRGDIRLLQQMWHDRHLKGMQNGVEGPAVEYFVLGANRWRTATDWPPPEARPQPWYFHSQGEANRTLSSGRLTSQAPLGAEPPDAYVYDPAHPVRNWMSFDLMEQWEDQQTWPYDFQDIESRPDVVTYTSAPLEADVTVAGDLRLVLYASTDVKDTDWWVHVSDVEPDNRSIRLTTGVLRARFRNRDDPAHGAFGSNYEKEELLSGNLDDVVRYDITLRPIANTFRKGHRIRVAIMNALDNFQFPNSNTGEDEALVTRTVAGKMKIHHSASHPSHIVVPVLPSP